MQFYMDVLLGPALALLTATVVLLAARPWRRDPEADSRGWWGAAGVAAGYAAGYAATLGLPPFPPVQAVERLLYLVLAAAAVALAAALLGWLGLRRAAAVSCLVVGGVAYLLLPRYAAEWDGAEMAEWLAGLGLAGLVFWACLDDEAAHGSSPGFCLLMLAILAGTVAVATFSHSALLGQLAVLVLATCCPLLVAAWRWPEVPLAQGGAIVLAVVLPGLWLIGFFFSECPALSIGLLAAAPLAAVLARRGLPGRLASPRFAVLRLVVPLVLVGAGVALAVPESKPEDESSAYNSWVPPAASGGGSAGTRTGSSAPTPPASSGDENPFQALP